MKKKIVFMSMFALSMMCLACNGTKPETVDSLNTDTVEVVQDTVVETGTDTVQL